jgi:hypothetical protein
MRFLLLVLPTIQAPWRSGERCLLPDGEDSVRTVAVTPAVLQAIEERRRVAVPAVE